MTDVVKAQGELNDNVLRVLLATREDVSALRAETSAGIEGLESRVASMASQVNSMITSLRVDVMSRLDQHSTTLTSIKEDIAVNLLPRSPQAAQQ